MKDKLKLDESNRLYKEAQSLVPGGVSGVRRPGNFVPREYPIFFERADGGKSWDPDGNEYVDLMATYGAIVIGHRVKELDDAVIEQIREKGFAMTMSQPIQNQLTAKLKELIPSCDKTILVKTGSDATTAAIRIARAHTGRTKVLRCGYHGWHDWAVEVKSGIPSKLYEDVFEFHYNDLDELESLLKTHDNEVAAIIMWPLGTPLGKDVQMPKPGYLEGVRALADKHGAVLVFDELRTGFRVDLGGAQKIFGVTPDISVIGKAMGNGYEIAAVVGKDHVMKVAENKVFISSTYFPNSLAQVAAVKTIEILERDRILDALREKGETWGRKIEAVVNASGVPCGFSGIPWTPYIMFKDPSDMMNMKLRLTLYTHLIRAGVFLSPYHHGYFIHQHTDADLQRAVDAIAEGLDEIRKQQYA
jgi:glutamate-1-semialdehyde aminotransferase